MFPGYLLSGTGKLQLEIILYAVLKLGHCLVFSTVMISLVAGNTRDRDTEKIWPVGIGLSPVWHICSTETFWTRTQLKR